MSWVLLRDRDLQQYVRMSAIHVHVLYSQLIW